MAELDIIELSNPTGEDFEVYYNGEPYVLKAGQTKSFTKHVGYHVAKHLAHKMVDDSFTLQEKQDQKKALEIAKCSVFDNPRLRIALYKIMRDVHNVEQVILAFPYKGFIGEMSEYKQFVDNFNKPKEVKPSNDKISK